MAVFLFEYITVHLKLVYNGNIGKEVVLMVEKEVITEYEVYDRLDKLAQGYIKDNKGITVNEAYLWAKENFFNYYIIRR